MKNKNRNILTQQNYIKNDIFLTESILKNYLWSGTKLAQNFNKIKNIKTQKNNIAESIEFCLLPQNENKIINSQSLQLSNIMGQKLKEFYNQKSFIIKLIDSNDNLSIQVHPDDSYAKCKYGEFCNGKSEAWYILNAEKHAGIFAGFKEFQTPQSVLSAINNASIEQLLNFVEVKTGDLIFIPSGTPHAIGKGITLYEVQQQSDITYRLFDYNRVDALGQKRELHLFDALNTLNYCAFTPNIIPTCNNGIKKFSRKIISPLKLKNTKHRKHKNKFFKRSSKQFLSLKNNYAKTIISTDFFNIDKICVDGCFNCKLNNSSNGYYVLTQISGFSTAKTSNSNAYLKKGQTAICFENKIKFKGFGKILIAYN